MARQLGVQPAEFGGIAVVELFGNVEFGTLSYVGYDFMLIVVAVLCGLAVWWGLNRTRIGKIVLAVG